MLISKATATSCPPRPPRLSQGVQETHNDENGATRILAKYIRLAEPEILAEVYRIYGQKHLQKTINVDLESVRRLLKASAKKPPAPTRRVSSMLRWCRSWKKKVSFRRKTNNALLALFSRKSCKPKKRNLNGTPANPNAAFAARPVLDLSTACRGAARKSKYSSLSCCD